MSVVYVIDEIFEAHAPPREHPERPQRLGHVRSKLEATRLKVDGLALPIRDPDDAELGAVHAAAYMEELARVMPGQNGWLDEDTYFSDKSWQAARAAAAAAIDTTRAVLDGRAECGLALVRPPGHHAEADRAMGFCLFNNIAIAAAAARAAGAGRVAVLDFDVHHGNGTQHMFERDPDVLFMSVHQHPYYPGTGAPTEIGIGAGRGATINVGLPEGCGDVDYLAVLDRVFAPAIARFAPDILLVSAGFDAADVDPLAGMNVTRAGYQAIAEKLKALADAHAQSRFVAVLEGGYDLDGLAGGVVALADTMLGRPASFPLGATGSEFARGASAAGDLAISATLSAHAEAA